MTQKSLRHYLETQADRVEAVLAAHRAPGRVTGGTVGPQLIRFVIQPAPHVRFSEIRNLTDDLALALRVGSLRVDRTREGVILELPNPDPRPVELLDLLPQVQPVPVATALLGLTDDGVPLLARLSSPEVAHVLVAGTTGSGKTVLLRTMMLSLMLTHSVEQLQIVCIDPKNRLLCEFSGSPHLVRGTTESAESTEALQSLVRLMEQRDRHGETTPRIVVVIDELADLLFQGGGALEEALTRLAQRGREAGLHLVAATQRPSATVLSGLLRANFPLRLVGKVASVQDSTVAAGRGQVDAHLLNGRGDFLAVGSTDQPLRFQVAYVSDREVRREVEKLAREVKAQPIVLPSGSVGADSNTSVCSQLDTDVSALVAAISAGAQVESFAAAERALFGEVRGGTFWHRARAALQVIKDGA